MEIKTDGIVLRCVNYRDADRMLTLLTREHGRLDMLARGCRNMGSRLMACTQQFCYGEFIVHKKNDRYSLRQCELRDSFFALRNDFDKLLAGTGMLAAAEKTALPEHPDEALFMWLLYFLSVLCHGEVDPVDIALCFIVKLLEHSGYRPALTDCVVCSRSLGEDKLWLDPFAGGVACESCAGAQAVKAGALSVEAIRRMLLVTPENLVRVRLPKRVSAELVRFLPQFAENRMEKRFDAFRSLFQDAGS